MRHANGDEYQGHWVNDLPHGVGPLRRGEADFWQKEDNVYVSNGVGKYVGGFLRGKRSGLHGIMYHANGDMYSGGWLEDRPHGHGEYTCVSHPFVPLTKCRFANGAKFSGRWRRGLRHGTGTVILPDHSALLQEWVDGVLAVQFETSQLADIGDTHTETSDLRSQRDA